jgi:hypothetical protein
MTYSCGRNGRITGPVKYIRVRAIFVAWNVYKLQEQSKYVCREDTHVYYRQRESCKNGF